MSLQQNIADICRRYLEDLLQVGRIDLILLPEADPFLALDIIKGELLYTDDPDQQARHELFVLRRAGDLLPFKKDIGTKLSAEGILSKQHAALYRQIAGYRNRMDFS